MLYDRSAKVYAETNNSEIHFRKNNCETTLSSSVASSSNLSTLTADLNPCLPSTTIIQNSDIDSINIPSTHHPSRAPLLSSITYTTTPRTQNSPPRPVPQFDAVLECCSKASFEPARDEERRSRVSATRSQVSRQLITHHRVSPRAVFSHPASRSSIVLLGLRRWGSWRDVHGAKRQRPFG